MCIFENHKRPTVTIQKENSITHDPIQYAEFHITWASNKTDTGELRDLGTFQTDEAGQIILEGIEDGWLKIEGDQARPRIPGPGGPGYGGLCQGRREQDCHYLQHAPVGPGGLQTGQRDRGRNFRLSVPTALFGRRDQRRWRHGGGHLCDFGQRLLHRYRAQKGYYICEELESDSGHVIDAAPQAFYISGANQDIVTLYFSNAPKGSVLVKKVSASDNAPLSDVEFLVTTSDGAVVGDANGKFVTDSTGSFLISGIDPGTTLVIRETRAKDGYLLDDAPRPSRSRRAKPSP